MATVNMAAAAAMLANVDSDDGARTRARVCVCVCRPQRWVVASQMATGKPAGEGKRRNQKKFFFLPMTDQLTAKQDV